MKIENLIEDFKNDKLPIHGNVSMYGRYFGKPGDTFSKIKEMSYKDNVLTIDTGYEKIYLKSPEGIKYNHYNLVIKNAESVYVDEKEYSFKEDQSAFDLFDLKSQQEGYLVK